MSMRAEGSATSRHDDRSPLIEIGRDGDEGPLRLLVCGDLDAESARRLQQSLIDVLRRHDHGDLALDVSGLTLLDSAGIEALLRCQADAEQLECRLTLTGPDATTYRILQVAGLLGQFGIAKPRPDADGPGTAGAALGLVNCGLAG
jgi:anti-anti-sigma factor